MTDGLRPRYLAVHLHGILCGYLCEAGRTTRFVPSEQFRGDSARPTLSLSLTIPGNEALTATILSNPFHPALYNTQGELPPYFAGLLPEGNCASAWKQPATIPMTATISACWRPPARTCPAH